MYTESEKSQVVISWDNLAFEIEAKNWTVFIWRKVSYWSFGKTVGGIFRHDWDLGPISIVISYGPYDELDFYD